MCQKGETTVEEILRDLDKENLSRVIYEGYLSQWSRPPDNILPKMVLMHYLGDQDLMDCVDGFVREKVDKLVKKFLTGKPRRSEVHPKERIRQVFEEFESKK